MHYMKKFFIRKFGEQHPGTNAFTMMFYVKILSAIFSIVEFYNFDIEFDGDNEPECIVIRFFPHYGS